MAILLSDSIGASGGLFPILGSASPRIVGNADLTLSTAQIEVVGLKVTSDGTSTGIRKVIVPVLEQGVFFIVENATTEASHFAINFGAASGSTVTIPWNTTAFIYCPDGANFVQIGTSGTLSFANAAALEAFPVAGLPDGTQAYTDTFGGAYWALQPTGQTADGSTLLNASDGRIWARTTAANPLLAAAQTAWFVDPVGGDDEADGLTIGTALAHKAEIMRRCGTWSPELDAIDVVVTMVSSDDASGTDPGLFAPVLRNAATFLITAALPAPAFTGTLNVVTAKNRAGNTPLRSTFTTTTGAMASTLMLVNATRGNSVAFAHRDTGGGVWQISQPLAPSVPLDLPAPVEVDTWAHGDAIDGYALVAVDLPIVGGLVSEYGAGAGVGVYRITVLDPPGAGSENQCAVDGLAFPILTESYFARQLLWNGTAVAFPGVAANCYIEQPAIVSGSTQLIVAAGVLGAASSSGATQTLQRCSLQFDPIVNTQTIVRDVLLIDVFWDVASSILLQGLTLLQGAQYGAPVFFKSNGDARKNTGATWVQTLPLASGITIDGSAQAYSNLTTAGLVATHRLALTPAALDAAAGAAGFGGLAYVPSVGAFSDGNVP